MIHVKTRLINLSWKGFDFLQIGAAQVAVSTFALAFFHQLAARGIIEIDDSLEDRGRYISDMRLLFGLSTILSILLIAVQRAIQGRFVWNNYRPSNFLSTLLLGKLIDKVVHED